MTAPRRLVPVAALLALLAVTAGVYWPGLSGPFLFDDTVNILRNPALRIGGLNAGELWRAAWSMQSGPLGRPVAYVSFALDYLADGQRFAAPAFKRTNLGIHLFNTVLAAALAWRLSARAFAGEAQRRAWFALLTAAVFALHPLALSPVLYVVQRMASLSTLFVLTALLCLLRARERVEDITASRGHGPRLDGNENAGAGHARDRDPSCGLPGTFAGTDPAHDPVAAVRPILHNDRVMPASFLTFGAIAPWIAAGLGFAVLGVLTKESAALLAPLYLLADRLLYPHAPYWQALEADSRAGRMLRIGLTAFCALAAAAVTWHYAGQFEGRGFNQLERVLTQARVLCFYLGLFALPRINAFGLYHDDIAISTDLLTPWTTLPAIAVVVGLVGLGFALLRKRPLMGFGLLWFFAGHLLESTVVPLEIAHEHRNYLPLLGLAMASADALFALWTRNARAGAALTSLVLLTLAGTTALRATEWGNRLDFHRYQVAHHPRSAASHNDYARALALHGDFAGAQDALREAQALMPGEAGYYFNYFLTARVNKLPVPGDVESQLDALLAGPDLSPFGVRALSTLGDCLRDVCAVMAPDMVRWVGLYLAAAPDRPHADYLEFLRGIAHAQLGEIILALNAFERSYTLQPKFLNPLFDQANLFMARGQWDNAAFNLARIRAANDHAWVRRDKEIAQLEAAIAKGRGQDAPRSDTLEVKP